MMTWDFVKSVLAVLGLGGLTAAAVIGAAYALFRLFAEKWINQKFAEQLETFKSEQARELERLRHKINGAFDPTKRLHDREFEALPEIWAKLVEAKGWAQSYLSAYKQYADLTRMSLGDLDEFPAETNFSESHKREIRGGGGKQQDIYIRLFEAYRYTAKSFGGMTRISNGRGQWQSTGLPWPGLISMGCLPFIVVDRKLAGLVAD
jgi:hypothetical protein